jgi:hypothetical protein
MNYFFAIFEVGGGLVSTLALSTSSTLPDTSLSSCPFALVWLAFLFHVFSFCPIWAGAASLYQGINLPRQPVRSNALFAGEPLSLRLLNGNLHGLWVTF